MHRQLGLVLLFLTGLFEYIPSGVLDAVVFTIGDQAGEGGHPERGRAHQPAWARPVAMVTLLMVAFVGVEQWIMGWGEEPQHEADAGAACGGLGDSVVALLDGDVALQVLAHDGSAPDAFTAVQHRVVVLACGLFRGQASPK